MIARKSIPDPPEGVLGGADGGPAGNALAEGHGDRVSQVRIGSAPQTT